MQTTRLFAIIIIVGVIALALGITIGYILTSGRASHTATGCCISDLYKVEFIQQAGMCPPSIPMYVVPWSVTLGNQTKVQPPNASIKSDEIAGQGYSVYSQILFLVPNGIYNYTLNQNGSGYYPFVVSSGTVSVSGSNVTVKVGPPEVYCTAASSTSSTITTTCSAGYVNGTCGPMTTTTTTLFDGASYCLSSNKCSTLYPLGRSLLLQNNLVVSARFSSHAVEDKHIGQLRSFLFSRTGSAARTIVRVN